MGRWTPPGGHESSIAQSQWFASYNLERVAYLDRLVVPYRVRFIPFACCHFNDAEFAFGVDNCVLCQHWKVATVSDTIDQPEWLDVDCVVLLIIPAAISGERRAGVMKDDHR